MPDYSPIVGWTDDAAAEYLELVYLPSLEEYQNHLILFLFLRKSQVLNLVRIQIYLWTLKDNLDTRIPESLPIVSSKK